MYNKILLPSDGSDHSIRAAKHAIELAKLNEKASIELVYVTDTTRAKEHTLQNWNKIGINEAGEVEISNTEKALQDAGVSYSVKRLKGDPGPTIVEHANLGEFDVVVVGSRGLNKLQEMVLGSVSHKVAKRAKCPVLIVK
ncbi:universal stress protein [Salirhabdus salicampi]|uniref:universal stress protein n=1 Tax=Salirhabdus salicampi TaxID=476102 RepID=UPI0020C50748|nr:universal stress protein [Salirhabdus salicampi]MCP8615455.1 universal stress protein [Salirhabdus salicampi]